MSISDLSAGLGGGLGRFTSTRHQRHGKAGLYAPILAIGVAVLATPIALVAALTAAFDLPQPMLFPWTVSILVVDLCLAARLSGLLSQAAATGRMPGLPMWRLPVSLWIRFAAILLLAPWPFDIAFALIGDHAPIYLQVPVFFLAAVAAFGGIASMVSVLAEAFHVCVPRHDATE
jgi:hypothetical protein